MLISAGTADLRNARVGDGLGVQGALCQLRLSLALRVQLQLASLRRVIESSPDQSAIPGGGRFFFGAGHFGGPPPATSANSASLPKMPSSPTQLLAQEISQNLELLAELATEDLELVLPSLDALLRLIATLDVDTVRDSPLVKEPFDRLVDLFGEVILSWCQKRHNDSQQQEQPLSADDVDASALAKAFAGSLELNWLMKSMPRMLDSVRILLQQGTSSRWVGPSKVTASSFYRPAMPLCESSDA